MKKKEGDSVSKTGKNFGKYFLLGIIILFVFLSYKIIEPYIIVLLSAFVFTYLSKPLYKFLIKRNLNKYFSAWVCIMIVLGVFIIPIALVTTQISLQTYSYINSGLINEISNTIDRTPLINNLNIDFSASVQKATSYIFSLVSSIALKIPTILLSLIIFLFAFFYILIDWDKISAGLKKFIPFENKENIVNEIDKATHGIIFGYLFIAIIDFVVSAVGFYFLGIKFHFLLAFLLAITVFIPGLGPMIVMIPICLYFALAANWVSFILALVLWAIISIVIETILMTIVLGERSRVHPLLMILGIVGGTAIFGLFGFVIGPLILVYTIKIIQGISENI